MALKEEFEYIGKPLGILALIVSLHQTHCFICPLAVGSILYHMAVKCLPRPSPVSKNQARLNMLSVATDQSEMFMHLRQFFFSLFIFMFINPWLFVNVLVRLNKSGGCLYLFFTVSFQLSDVPIVFSSTLQGRSVLKVPDSPKSRKSPRFLRRDQSHHRLLMLMINVFQVILFLKISNLQ